MAAKARAAAGVADAPNVSSGDTLPPPALGPTSASTSGVETPGATVAFVGNIETRCGFIPSDMALAVGDDTPPYPVLQANNNCISIFTKSGTIAPGYPKIAGQHPDYVYVALKAYTVDGNPHVGRGNAVMGAVAKQFKLEELKELAQYVGSQDGELATVPESRFR